MSSIPDHKELLSGLKTALRESDQGMTDRVGKRFAQVMLHTKNARDPLSTRWDEGVRVFLCGGGRHLSVLREKMDALVKSGIDGRYRLQLHELEQPEDLEISTDSLQDFDRLAVAYGLSFSALDFGDMRSPDQIPDIVLPKRDRPLFGEYIDKDMV